MATKEEILDNLLKSLPEFYNKESTSNNYQLLNSFSSSYSVLSNQISELKLDIQISTASGERLNDIGALFNLTRNPNETDVSFRSRIKSFWAGLLGGGTEKSIKNSLSGYLGISEDNITITSDYANMKIDIQINEDVNLTLFEDLTNIVNQNKAAGIGLKNIVYSSENDIFRVNLSEINGEDEFL